MRRAAASDWMPFHGQRFFESEHVAAMEPAAQMLYLRCLWRQWTHGPLPADERVLQRLFPEYALAWESLWPTVRPCFDDVDGRLVNSTLKTLRQEADALSARARRGADAANATRAQSPKKADYSAREPLAERSRDARATLAKRLRTQLTVTETETERRERSPLIPPPGGDSPPTKPPIAKPAKPPTPKRINPATCELPPEIDRPDVRDALVDYLETRKGGAWNERLAAVRLAQLARWGPERAIAALRHSCGYQGLFEPSGEHGTAPRANGNGTLSYLERLADQPLPPP